MPKRDADYMQEQRDKILQAALECVLDKGLAATSTREICIQAGVSKGALYTHFKTRHEMIIAAAVRESILPQEPADDWVGYERLHCLMLDLLETSERHRKISRLWFEFLAELLLADRMLPTIYGEWDRNFRFVRESLRAAHAKGEISLPLGLNATVELHAQMIMGVTEMLLADQRRDFAQVRANFLTAIAFTAGRQPSNGAVKPAGGEKPSGDTSSGKRKTPGLADARGQLKASKH